MAERHILVWDAGSSSARCALFDASGSIVAQRAAAWPIVASEDGPALARELDPRQVWSSFCSMTAGCLDGLDVRPAEVAAVAITSQRQAVVFMDDAGEVVYAGPNTDLRAVFDGAAIDEQAGDRLYRATGHTPAMILAPAKLQWFRLHRPDAYGRIASVLTLADWLAWRLSGTMASEAALAGEAGLLDITSGGWASTLLRDLGLIENGHVPIVRPGAVVGRVDGRAAEDTGLPKGAPVVLSGPDTQAGLLGMGVVDAPDVGVVAGWSAPLQMVTDRPVLSPTAATWAGLSTVHGRWVLESSAGDAGNSYRWLAETLSAIATAPSDGDSAFRRMDALAQDAPPGSDGLLVFLGPSRMDMGGLGLRQGGILLPVPMALEQADRSRVVRAALEAIAYAVRANLEQAENLSGERATRIAVGGGMTRTSIFARILADVIGREIVVSQVAEVSSVGAYLCAATGIGEFASLSDAAASRRARMSVMEPDRPNAVEYEGHYDRWLGVESRLKEIPL